MHSYLDQSSGNEVVEGLGPARGRVQGRGVALLYLEQDAHGGHLVVGRLHLGELDQGYAEGPDVDLLPEVNRKLVI